MLGLSASLSAAAASMRSYVKDNLKLYLDFKSTKSNTLKFPCEGSTSFDGSDYITVSDNDSLDLDGTGYYTIAVWLRADVDIASDTFNIANKYSSNTGWMLSVTTTNNLRWETGDGSAVDTTKSANDAFSTTVGKWQHCAITGGGGGKTKMYIDGVELGSLVTDNDHNTIATTTADMLIGTTPGAGSGFWNGAMANLGMWDRALSLEEVNSVMRKNYSKLKSIEKTSLVSWWSLDEDINPLITGRGLVTDSHDTETTGSNMLSSINTTDWSSSGSSIVINNAGTIDYDDTSDAHRANNDNQTTLFQPNENYKVTFTVSGLTSGTAQIKLYDNGNNGIGEQAGFANGTHTTYAWSSAEVGKKIRIGLFSSSTSSFSMSDIEVLKLSGNNGRIVGATPTKSVYGGNAPVLPRSVDVAREGEADAIGNGSALFDGVDDIVNCGSDSSLDNPFNGGGVFTAWIYPKSDGEGNLGTVVTKRASSTAGFYIGLGDESSGACDLRFWQGRVASSGIWETTSRELTINDWNHISLVYNDDSTSNDPIFYINGINVAITETSTPSGDVLDSASASLEIGSYGGTMTFDGNISQVGIWQGALTQEMVQSVMESTSYAKIPASVKNKLTTLVGAGDWTAPAATWTYDAATEYYTSSYDGSEGIGNLVKSPTIVVGNRYRFQYTVVSNNGANIKFPTNYFGYDGSARGDTAGETYTFDGVALASGTNYGAKMGLRTGSNDGGVSVGVIVLSNVTLKEINNDLVGYWALDADNSIDVLSFGGDGDHINCGSDTSLALATDFTISVWFNSSDVTGYERLVSRGQYNSGFIFGLNDDNLDFTFKDANDPSHTARAGATNMTANLWYHGVAVSNSSTGKVHVYLNGVDDGNMSITHPIQTPSADFRIGSEDTNHFNGKIAQVAVYNTALSASQILTQYNLGVDGDYSSDDNLIGYWKLNTEGTVTDLGSGGNNGTATGTTLVENAVALDSTSNNNNGDLL